MVPPIAVCPSEDLNRVLFEAFQCRPSLKRLGSSLTQPSIIPSIGESLFQAFQSIRQYIILREFYVQTGKILSPENTACFHQLSWIALYSALRIPFDGPVAREKMAEPCRLALLIFWNANNQLNGPRSLLYTTLAQHLRQALRRIETDIMFDRSPKIWMWILLLGAFISYGNVRAWFLSRMAHFIHRNQISWQRMRLDLLDLFYIESIYEAGFSKSWQEAESLAKLSYATLDGLPPSLGSNRRV